MSEKPSRFRIMKQGYDRFEVDHAISELQSQIEEMQSKLTLYKSQTETSQTQLNLVKQRYQTLISELNMREKAADEIARLALKEANHIIDAAQNNADSIVREALSTARIILVEMARISADASEVKEELKDKLDALSKSLEDLTLPAIPNLTFLNSIEEE